MGHFGQHVCASVASVAAPSSATWLTSALPALLPATGEVPSALGESHPGQEHAAAPLEGAYDARACACAPVRMQVARVPLCKEGSLLLKLIRQHRLSAGSQTNIWL